MTEGFVVNPLPSGSRPQTYVQGPLGRKVGQLSSESRERDAADLGGAREKAKRDLKICLGTPQGDRVVGIDSPTRPQLTSSCPSGTQRRTTGPLGAKVQKISYKAGKAQKKQEIKAKLKRDEKAEKERKEEEKEKKTAYSGAKRGTAPAGDEQTRPHGKRRKVVSFALPPEPSKPGTKKPKAAKTDPRKSSK